MATDDEFDFTWGEWLWHTRRCVDRLLDEIAARWRDARSRVAHRFGRHDWQPHYGLRAVPEGDHTHVALLERWDCRWCEASRAAEPPSANGRFWESWDDGRTWTPFSAGDEGGTGR